MELAQGLEAFPESPHGLSHVSRNRVHQALNRNRVARKGEMR
jgi:hypothetical protein